MARHIPAETKARAVEMYVGHGMASETVAAELNISPSSVTAWVRNAGHEVRPARGADDIVDGSPRRLTARHGRWVRDGLVMRWEAVA